MAEVAIINAAHAFPVPSMAKTNARGMDFTVFGAQFTVTFWWLPDQAIMSMRISNDGGTLRYCLANPNDPILIRGAVPGARTNTDLVLSIIPPDAETAFTPQNASKFVLGVMGGKVP